MTEVVRYRRERWIALDGKTVIARLTTGIVGGDCDRHRNADRQRLLRQLRCALAPQLRTSRTL